MLTFEDKKELAEWYGWIYRPFGKSGFYDDASGHIVCGFEEWEPDINANQRDMLWDKYVRDANIAYTETYYYTKELKQVEIKVHSANKLLPEFYTGNNEGEARLSANLNYVKSLKEGK